MVVQITNSERYHPYDFYTQTLINNGTHKGKPIFISDNGSKKIILRWNDTFRAWTISGQTSKNVEIIRFMSKSDVSNPVKAIWWYLPNGTENERISAPLMYVNSK